MKKLFCLFLLIFVFVRIAVAQEADEIAQWQFKFSKESLKVGDEVELIFSTNITKGWSLYSTDFKADMGPQPTEFEFTKNDSFSISSGIVPILPLKKVDKTWGTALSYFTKKAEFRAKINIQAFDYVVEGRIIGQLCNDKKGMCIPFQKTFHF
jgi:thiol:disulfide interchange protein DsbD